MRNPALKTKDGERFGVLVFPNDDVNSDEELYEAVNRYGRAVIAVYKGASCQFEKEITLTPAEFEKEWQGD